MTAVLSRVKRCTSTVAWPTTNRGSRSPSVARIAGHHGYHGPTDRPGSWAVGSLTAAMCGAPPAVPAEPSHSGMPACRAACSINCKSRFMATRGNAVTPAPSGYGPGSVDPQSQPIQCGLRLIASSARLLETRNRTPRWRRGRAFPSRSAVPCLVSLPLDLPCCLTRPEGAQHAVMPCRARGVRILETKL